MTRTAAPDQTGRWSNNYAGVIGNTYHRNRIRIAIDMLKGSGPLRGQRAFDFGCGEGALMRELLMLGVETAGCDTSDDLIALAPSGAKLGSVEILEAEPDGSLDLLIALNVLAYLTSEQQDRFWIAARRKVKPGGVVLHTIPNAFGTKPNRDHHSVENPETYPAKLRERGFTEIARAFNGYYGMIFRWHLLSQVTRWDKIARHFGLWSRGGRIYHPWRLALAPEAWRMRRSTGYISLSRRA